MEILIYSGNTTFDKVQKTVSNYKRKELIKNHLIDPIAYGENPTHTAIRAFNVIGEAFKVEAIASGTQLSLMEPAKWTFRTDNTEHDTEIILMILKSKLHTPYGYFQLPNYLKRWILHPFVKDDRAVGPLITLDDVCTEIVDFGLLRFANLTDDKELETYLGGFNSNMIFAIEILQICTYLHRQNKGILTKNY